MSSIDGNWADAEGDHDRRTSMDRRDLAPWDYEHEDPRHEEALRLAVELSAWNDTHRDAL